MNAPNTKGCHPRHQNKPKKYRFVKKECIGLVINNDEV